MKEEAKWLLTRYLQVYNCECMATEEQSRIKKNIQEIVVDYIL